MRLFTRLPAGPGCILLTIWPLIPVPKPQSGPYGTLRRLGPGESPAGSQAAASFVNARTLPKLDESPVFWSHGRDIATNPRRQEIPTEMQKKDRFIECTTGMGRGNILHAHLFLS